MVLVHFNLNHYNARFEDLDLAQRLMAPLELVLLREANGKVFAIEMSGGERRIRGVGRIDPETTLKRTRNRQPYYYWDKGVYSHSSRSSRAPYSYGT